MAGPNSGELFTLLLPPTGVPVGGQRQTDGVFVPELFDAAGNLLVNVTMLQVDSMVAQGITFSTGISICVTGGYGQTNTTNATASAISLNVGYK